MPDNAEASSSLDPRLRDARALCALSADFYHRGWAFGTSGNYSVRLSQRPLRLLITASGKDKRTLRESDLVVVEGSGQVLEGSGPPSAETLLHVALAEDDDVGAVLHTHSVWNSLVSDRFAHNAVLTLPEHEMLKGLEGIDAHTAEVQVAVYPNTQDIASLARVVKRRRAAEDPAAQHAFLIHRHGLYTWGRDLDQARRHVEVLEFLFEYCGRSGAAPPQYSRHTAALPRQHPRGGAE